MILTRTICIIASVFILHGCSTRNDSDNATDNNSGILDDGADTAPLLSVDNYRNRVAYALTFFANEQLPGPQMSVIAQPSFTNVLSSTIDPNTGLEKFTYTCENGGEAIRTENAGPDTFDLNNCQVGDTVFNGQLTHSFGKYGTSSEYSKFSGMVNGGVAHHEITGSIINTNLSTQCGYVKRSRAVQSYTISLGDQQFELKDWNTDYKQQYRTSDVCSFDLLEVSGGFSVRSADTDNRWLKVDASEDFSGTHSMPLRGTITLTAEDQSTITINAASSSDDTFVVTITNKAGVMSFDQDNTDWLSSLIP